MTKTQDNNKKATTKRQKKLKKMKVEYTQDVRKLAIRILIKNDLYGYYDSKSQTLEQFIDLVKGSVCEIATSIDDSIDEIIEQEIGQLAAEVYTSLKID